MKEVVQTSKLWFQTRVPGKAVAGDEKEVA